MNTVMVIRSKTITMYWDRYLHVLVTSIGEDILFQVYYVNPETNRTTLDLYEVYSSEQEAIDKFNEFIEPYKNFNR